jgi:hypothetical protein
MPTKKTQQARQLKKEIKKERGKKTDKTHN